MFGSDDSRLHEEDFIFVPEFRSYLEGYRKTSGTRLTRKTINRHVINIMDFLYYSSTHNRHVHENEPDEIPVDQTLLRRGKDYFSAYFEGWLTYTNGLSEESIIQSVSSVKKFYKFRRETGRMETPIADDIIDDLRFY